MTTRRALLFLILPLLAGIPVRAQSLSRTELYDVNGRKVRPLEGKDRKATVFIFVTHDCPISNKYAPEVSRIHRAYAPKKIPVYIVYVEPKLTPAEARKHVKEFRYPCPALLDPNHKLVRLSGATVTPEAAVFAPDGRRLYRGRIDDLYLELGKSRYTPSKRDLRLALDAILQGKPVPTPTTRAVGCFIPTE